MITKYFETEQKMKKVLRILLPILLVIVIISGSIWYLFVYDREFTRDVLLGCARFCESQGHHSMSTWFYNRAYNHAADNDAVAIELAEQYTRDGNYTKAEYTLSKAIADGGSIDVYIALCRTYVEQDKLLDAVTMLNSVTNAEVKAQLETLRPRAPQSQTAPGLYNDYISIALTADTDTVYAANDGEYPSVTKDLYSAPITLTDGENEIYAVAVSDNGLVSPLAVLSYTVGGVVKEMEFTDTAIEAAIREILGADDGRILYTNDLWGISEFTVPSGAESYDDLQSLAFLKTLVIERGPYADMSSISALENLTELTITNTSVSASAFEGIASLPLLEKLTISDCSLSTLAPLEQAQNLTYLDVSNNVVSNLAPLSGLTKLTEVYLQDNAIGDISPLASLSSLEKLDVSGNTLTSLSPLAEVTGLTWLKADANGIADLSGIGNLSALAYLSVNNNQLTSVTELSGCSALTELYLSTNSLTDISVLAGLEKLTDLDFSYNSVENIPAFSTTCALVTIDGTKNLITSLEPLDGLENLNNVHMDYNEGITSVDCLIRCHNLIQVNVFGTKVKTATSLTELDIIVNYNPVS